MNEKNKSRPPRCAAVHFTIQIKKLASALQKQNHHHSTYSQSIYWAWLFTYKLRSLYRDLFRY